MAALGTGELALVDGGDDFEDVEAPRVETPADFAEEVFVASGKSGGFVEAADVRRFYSRRPLHFLGHPICEKTSVFEHRKNASRQHLQEISSGPIRPLPRRRATEGH